MTALTIVTGNLKLKEIMRGLSYTIHRVDCIIHDLYPHMKYTIPHPIVQ